MLLDQTYDLIQRIAAITSTTEKEEAVKFALRSPAFAFVAEYACDPAKKFYATSAKIWIPAPTAISELHDDPWTLEELRQILDKMADRNNHSANLTRLHDICSGTTHKTATVIGSILDNDLRCGVSVKTLNKAKPGFIPTFDPMLAQPTEHLNLESLFYPLYAEHKYDGWRCIIKASNDPAQVRFYSRTGKIISALKPFDVVVAKMHSKTAAGQKNIDVMLDSEVVNSTFWSTASSMATKQTPVDISSVRFMVFDAMPWADYAQKRCRWPHDDRRRLANAFVSRDGQRKFFELLAFKEVCNPAEILEAFYDAKAKGLEGLILKRPHHTYAFRRHKDWLKVKSGYGGPDTIDVKVTGWQEGTGKYVGKMGALTFNYTSPVTGKTSVVKVGSGFSDAERELTTEWIGRTIEVAYSEETPDGSLRHTRFVRSRPDKE